jgi:hypothetical protein
MELREFLGRACRTLRMGVTEEGPDIWHVEVPPELRRHFFDRAKVSLTFDPRQAALDLRLEPAAVGSLLVDQFINAIQAACPQAVVARSRKAPELPAASPLQGTPGRLRSSKDRPYLYVHFGVRFVREFVDEQFHSVWVDLERGTAFTQAIEPGRLGELEPVDDPIEGLAPAYALACAELERAVKPVADAYEAELKESLRREVGRIDAYYAMLREEKAATPLELEAERQGLVEEQQKKYALRVRVEPTSAAILWLPEAEVSPWDDGPAALYNPFLDYWVLPACGACGKPAAGVVACGFKHLVCASCAASCDVCHLKVCRTCAVPCGRCGRKACPACRTECAGCGKAVCASCAKKCAGCGKPFCSETSECAACRAPACGACRKTCVVCGKAHCPAHAEACAACGGTACPAHAATSALTGRRLCAREGEPCPRCGGFAEKDRLAKCLSCEVSYCPSCLQESACLLCRELTESLARDPVVEAIMRKNKDLLPWLWTRGVRAAVGPRAVAVKAKVWLTEKLFVFDKESGALLKQS